jgi:phosphoribosylformylglycinamidine synthase
VAVLREQGVNSHVEMAYAFTEAGFDAFDIHMTDLQTGRANLADFAGVVGTRLPIAVAHGEGYANFKHRGNADQAIAAMRFTDNFGAATEAYPFNPNGSPGGLTAVTTADGRFTAMMPHPERVFRNIQMSWTQGDPAAFSAWMPLWHNARRWVG